MSPAADPYHCQAQAHLVAKPFIPTTRDLPASVARRIVDALLNLVFPESCFVCDAPVSRHQDCGVCDMCWGKALRLRIQEPWCASCGLPFQNLGTGETHLCSDCILRPPPFSGARSFGYYAAELSRMVLYLKFRRRQNLVGLLAPLLTSTFFDSWQRSEFDVIVPVPLHPRRRRERGYNQAALLGRALARHVALPICENALLRVRYTVPQVGLTDPERLRNVHGAFRCRKQATVANQRVLLVDDVMTTGATLASAAEALLRGGALRVSAITVARAVPGLQDL
ncbi:MAG TPA: ComF family protein [Acidobacteriota bacterium]|nr:ComF family protein [Acidobacteriota bacterium]